MKIWISGACGHMGREVAAAAKAAGVEIAGGIDPAGGEAAFPLYASFRDAPETKDAVIVDFSSPDVLPELLAYARRTGQPAVLATTGYTDGQLEEIREASQQVAVFRSANMSIGIALLKMLCRIAARTLGEQFDVEIVEAHHRRKADAPSGTALMLYDALNSAYDGGRTPVCGRSGKHRREPQEIGIHALRGGTVAGEHQVCFLGPSERITLSHSAENRAVFAEGAIRAAIFLKDQAPGLYSMDELTAVMESEAGAQK